MKKLIIFLVLIIIFSGCEQAFLEDEQTNDPVTNFNALWSTFDKKYSYFTIKKINWDSVYQVYRPKVHQNMTDRELFNVMADMLFSLRDGHVNLFTDFNLSRNWQWYLDAPPNFDWDLIERNYLEEEYEISGPLRNKILEGNIGYIYYRSFLQRIDPDNIDYVIEKFKDTKGVIIDVRNNGGGSVSNSSRLASRFFDEERLVKLEVYKNGPAHNAFTPPVGTSIKPGGDQQFTKPIAVLSNRSSYSAANDFVLKMKALPYVTVFGDTTGGGGGLPVSYELPNGWRYRFSSTITFSPGGFSVEAGIPPDRLVYMDTTDILKGKDTIIEAALDFLKNQ